MYINKTRTIAYVTCTCIYILFVSHCMRKLKCD